MRVLVLGSGVIGSVYAAGLLGAGHDVVLLARGQRLLDLQRSGLVLHRADTDEWTTQPVEAVADVAGQAPFGLVLVPVQRTQLASVLPRVTAMDDDSDVVFFGNYSGREEELIAGLGHRALLGFPAVGGIRAGAVVRYVPISRQRTMLGEPNGKLTSRVRQIAGVLTESGFATSSSTRMQAWLLGHAAFIAPIGCALRLVDTDARRLAADQRLLRLVVLSTRQAFRALESQGSVELPANLRALYLRLPVAWAVAYWRRVLDGPRGELWFAAHTRAAPEEMAQLAQVVRIAVLASGRAAPDLMQLIERAHGRDDTAR